MARTSKLCWIIMARVGTLVLFLILEEMLSAFHHWENVSCGCIIYGLYNVELPGDASGKEPACQCRRCKRRWFDSWVRKILWRRKWQPIPWTEENGGQRIGQDWNDLGCMHSARKGHGYLQRGSLVSQWCHWDLQWTWCLQRWSRHKAQLPGLPRPPCIFIYIRGRPLSQESQSSGGKFCISH